MFLIIGLGDINLEVLVGLVKIDLNMGIVKFGFYMILGSYMDVKVRLCFVVIK